MPHDVRTPYWVKHAVFYQVFPDRFARSGQVALQPSGLEPWDTPPTVHGYKGGDLYGVVDRLDHLQDLGVTAIYLNPVFASGSNHRYHTHDYFTVDPMLGGNEALRALLDAAHARGMKLILDGVFNHASRGFLPFHDLLENGPASPYRDWFHVHGFPLGAYGEGDGTARYDAWWSLPALPKLNTDTPQVREYLLRVAEHWLRFGADGWRLDVPNEIDDDAFWREFRSRCRAVNPEAYLVGEIWEDATRWLQGDQFDAVMNYPITKAILGFAAATIDDDEVAKCGYKVLAHQTAEGFAVAVRAELDRHPRAIVEAQLNLLGSHDTPRVARVVGGDAAAVHLAALLQFTLPGAPCVYYGDEIGLDGGHDPACREAMPWGRTGTWDAARLATFRDLIALRHAHPALRTGDLEVTYAHHGVVAYRRRLGEDDLLVVANQRDEEMHARVPVAGLAAGVRTPLFGTAAVDVADGTVHVRVPGRAGVVVGL
ncbi:MAG: glycoside hydrolase family 13 protein [Trueperaceae bacterium]|nr:glycoside hydrolase family 13 protein [Trueperaceae bacterium]